MAKTADFIEDIRTIAEQQGMCKKEMCKLVQEIGDHLCGNKAPLYDAIDEVFTLSQHPDKK